MIGANERAAKGWSHFRPEVLYTYKSLKVKKDPKCFKKGMQRGGIWRVQADKNHGEKCEIFLGRIGRKCKGKWEKGEG